MGCGRVGRFSNGNKNLVYTNTPPSQQSFYDFHAAGYDLDYTLGHGRHAAVFAIAYCEYCYTRYAILPDHANSVWLLYNPKELAEVAPIAKVMNSEGYPICVNYECMSENRILVTTSMASVVTRDGQWLRLKQPSDY